MVVPPRSLYRDGRGRIMTRDERDMILVGVGLLLGATLGVALAITGVIS